MMRLLARQVLAADSAVCAWAALSTLHQHTTCALQHAATQLLRTPHTYRAPMPAASWPRVSCRFGLLLLSELLEADWSPVLLSHELCEEVLVQDTRAGAGVAVGAGRGRGIPRVGAHAQSALGALKQEAREQLAPRAASLTQQRLAKLPAGGRRNAATAATGSTETDHQQYLEPALRTSSRRASLPDVVTRTLGALAAATATASGGAGGAEGPRRGSLSAPRDRTFCVAGEIRDAREAGGAGGGGGREAGEPSTRMSLLPWAVGELRMGLGRLRLVGRSSNGGNHTQSGGAGLAAAGRGGRRSFGEAAGAAGSGSGVGKGSSGVLGEELEDGQMQQRMASFQRASEGAARAANTRVLYRGLRLRVRQRDLVYWRLMLPSRVLLLWALGRLPRGPQRRLPKLM